MRGILLLSLLLFPLTTHAEYLGNLSANEYDPNSIANQYGAGNPYGRYGNPYSPDSLNNTYGAGNPYRSDSPTNPYGSGWRIEGR